ncbi:MAG: hypothetical protein GY851_35020 [bacterium]|nr:hypothetical protein [bacterium]
MTERSTDTDILLKETLLAVDAESLHALGDLIHDEYFELDDVTFCQEQGIVTIPYRRMFHGGPSRLIRFWLLFATFEVDVIRSVLTIHHVQDCRIDDRSQIGTFSFNTISYDEGTLRIECNEDLDLHLTVTTVEAESRDVEVRGKARIYDGLLWESNSARVYE